MSKQPGQIIGAFTLRNEGDDCFSSKYHHVDSPHGPFMESCKKEGQREEVDEFEGDYRTVWLDDNGQHQAATMQIELNPANTSLFVVRWTDASNRLIFQGTAMRFEGMLIGAYWDQEE